jgi:D-alanine-D-alanine ligase
VILTGDGESGACVLSADAPHDRLARLDVVFPVMHGPFGEDGVIQGFLETLGVPYAGCGVLASAVAMDKVAMKRAFRAEDIPVAPYVWLTEPQWRAAADPAQVVAGLQWPLYVKPARMGSSIGVSRVTSPAELAGGVEQALRYDHVVLVEQGVAARELICGVLGGFSPVASVPGEVEVAPETGWNDYRLKYLATTDPVTIPAALPADVAAEVRELSLRAFRAIGGWGLARVDFLYDEAAGRLSVLEINTMPGFTSHSVYARAWAQSGISYAAVLSTLIDLAFTRHELTARGAAELAS